MADEDDWGPAPLPDFNRLRLGGRDAPATSGSSTAASDGVVGGAGDGLSSAGTVAVTTVEHDAAIDPVLTGAMENLRERVNVLKYENSMVQFMKAGTKQQQLELSPCSSYHRLLLYRLAQRFGLEHIAGEGEAGGVGMEPTLNRILVLFKTPQSAMPRLLLIDTCGKEGTNGASGGGDGTGKAPVMKLMRRSRPAEGQQGGDKGGSRRSGNDEDKSPSSTANGSKSMTDREKAYAEARARIFGAPSESAASSSSTSTSRAAGPFSSSSPAGGGLKGVKGAQASGPDGSGGFGAGRGKAMAGDSPSGDRRSTSPPYPSQQQRPEEGRRISGGGGGNGQDGDAGEGGGGGAKGEWSESKVVWRNREAEKSDPDFVRHHPSRGLPQGGGMMYAPSVGGGGGGGGGGIYAAMPGPYNSLPLPPGAPPGAYYVDPYMQQQMMQLHMAAMYHQQQQQQYHPHHQQQMPFLSSSIPPQGYMNDPRYASSPYYQAGGERGEGGDRGGGERGGGGRGRGRGRGFLVGGPLPSSHSRGGSNGSDMDQRGGDEEFPPLGR